MNPEDLKPKPPAKLAPQGIRTFTVCRQIDETGISGQGIVIEGAVLATGQCIVHWLYPPPRGGIAIFDSMEDFLKVQLCIKMLFFSEFCGFLIFCWIAIRRPAFKTEWESG